MTRIVGAAALLTLCTACFELDQRFTLNADGSAEMTTDMVFTKGFADTMTKMAKLDDEEELPWASWGAVSGLDPAETERLAGLGVTVTRYELDGESKTPEVHMAASATSVGALSELSSPLNKGEDSGTLVTLEKLENGDVRLHHVQLSSSGDDGGMEMSMDEDEPVSKKEMKDAEKALKLAMSLFEEMQHLRVNSTVTVPGTVQSATPAAFAQIEGNTVTWSITAETLMNPMMEQPAEEEEFTVVFTPSTPLPDSLFTASMSEASPNPKDALQETADDGTGEEVEDQEVSRPTAEDQEETQSPANE